MFLRPPGISDKGGDWKGERVRDFAKYAGDFDVICFQEVFSTFSPHIKALRRVCRDAGLKYYAWPSGPRMPVKGHVVDSGLFIVSRYPLRQHKFTPFRESAGPDGWAYKGVQSVTVEPARDDPKARPLTLFNVHLQASYTADQTDHSATRMKQRRQLMGLVHEVSTRYPVVVAGDFNSTDPGLSGFTESDGLTESSMRRYYSKGRTVSRAVAESGDVRVEDVKIDHIVGRMCRIHDAKQHAFESSTELGACSDHKGISAMVTWSS